MSNYTSIFSKLFGSNTDTPAKSVELCDPVITELPIYENDFPEPITSEDKFVSVINEEEFKNTNIKNNMTSNISNEDEISSGNVINIDNRAEHKQSRNKTGNYNSRSYLNSESNLSKFLNQNHYDHGFHTGFNYCNLDAKINGVEEIISEFLLLINEALQLQKEKQAVIQHHMLSIKDLPNSVEYAQFTHAIKESNRRIEDLNTEIILSKTQNGIIRKSISQYEMGFTKGFRVYMDNSDLLCN
jgi:hypothetical protein